MTPLEDPVLLLCLCIGVVGAMILILINRIRRR